MGRQVARARDMNSLLLRVKVLMRYGVSFDAVVSALSALDPHGVDVAGEIRRLRDVANGVDSDDDDATWFDAMSTVSAG